MNRTVAVLIISLPFAGCTRTFEVTSHPPFDVAQIRTVAILPFANLTPRTIANNKPNGPAWRRTCMSARK